MSNQVNNLAASFVAMAQAFEQLPQVQSELKRTEGELNQARDIITAREESIAKLKAELEAAHAATRKMEVERDHAETMFLETDSKLDQAKSVLKTLIGNAGEFLHVVEPPKPEPQPEPVAEPTPPQGESVLGESATSTDHTPASADTAPITLDTVHSDSVQPGVESAVNPTIASLGEVSHSQPTDAPDAGAASDANVASSTTGERAADPTALAQSSDSGNAVTSGGASNTEDASQPTTTESSGVSVRLDPTQATESSSEKDLSVSASAELPEPEPRYTPEWYQWADATGYWNKRQAAQ